MTEEIKGSYKVVSKSETGLQLEDIGWIYLTKELQGNTLPHIAEGQMVQIEGTKKEGYKYPLITVLIPSDEKQTFLTHENKAPEPVKTVQVTGITPQQYQDRREKGQIVGWAITTSIQYTRALSEFNGLKLISDEDFFKEVQKNAERFVRESHRMINDFQKIMGG